MCPLVFNHHRPDTELEILNDSIDKSPATVAQQNFLHSDSVRAPNPVMSSNGNLSVVTERAELIQKIKAGEPAKWNTSRTVSREAGL